MKKLLRAGGIFLLLFQCRKPPPSFHSLDQLFRYKRVFRIPAGKEIILTVEAERDEDYEIYIILKKGLFGSERKERMIREGKRFLLKIDGMGMEKGDVLFFWYEVWKGGEKLGTLPDNRGKEKLLLEGKIHWKDMIGRIEIK